MTKSTITREPITHYLKIYPEFFSAVCTGVKRAELRKNDRDYRVGDTLHLMETPRGSCHQTGEFINVEITHIADVGEWMPGYVLLSIEREALDSESVILYRERNPYNGLTTGWQELTENEFSFLKENAGENAEFLTLYRHAQQPVVPDEITSASAPEVFEIAAEAERLGLRGTYASYAVGWNACRAAMLQAEPVTTANKLPPNSFTDDELEGMAHGNNPQSNAYRELLAYRRNSPVIPDAWIPVSERNPNDIGRYWCYVEDQKSHGKYSYQWNCSWNGSYWSGAMMHGRVTHWMPLPAAPQEVGDA
ncbi:Protein of unknown function [[Enterobacter] aerogenes]|uniref:DUF3850 domain-containing protein n=1 Tax=Klebsiella aerogenes TaxID=548 RepID=UPI000915DEB8|nr:Protein of unknown function [[Enterobacter] aerogenes] [Klebsiella aerogenes]